jgi:hypothetical protein
MIFDVSVQRKQRIVAEAAKRSDAIVRSLFPGTLADRLYAKARHRQVLKQKKKNWTTKDDSGVLVATQKSRLLNLLRSNTDSYLCEDNEPLADLYPSASVVFAGKCRQPLCFQK